MLNRLAWNAVTLGSVAILVAVVYYFVGEYRSVQGRQDAVSHLRGLADVGGPCAALTAQIQVPAGAETDVRVLRETFASRVLGGGAGHKALGAAAGEGLIDGFLCEQIRLATTVGEDHPVIAMLRFNQDEDPCQSDIDLRRVISNLGSHRAMLLRGLMREPARLACLEPAMSQEVARQVATMLHDEPQVFDDLDVVRIAAYLDTWAPMDAAQAGCRIEAQGDISKLGHAIACTPDQQERVLGRYRYAHPIAGGGGFDALPAEAEVFLVWREGRAARYGQRASGAL